jgi:ElaB/YqjD/DUF883 family membrane-anchored ribosome-binding protein
MERIGKEKRDILVQRLRDGKKDQAATQEQLKTTLETFQELTGFHGGDLEKIYKKLNKELDRSQDRANQLSSRIQSIDRVASDLFTEWQKEIDSMADRNLKTQSTSMLRDTKRQHLIYMKRMHETEGKIAPVLQAFHDQVLFLKHNLNARAIQSLKTTATALDGQVNALIKDIQTSAQEADSFINTLSAAEGTEGGK